MTIDSVGETGAIWYLKGADTDKSEFASNLVKALNGQGVILSRDAWRVMLGGTTSDKQETMITWCMEASAVELARRGAVIIVIDDKSRVPEYDRHWHDVAARVRVECRCLDLCSTE